MLVINEINDVQEKIDMLNSDNKVSWNLKLFRQNKNCLTDYEQRPIKFLHN